MPIKWLLCLVAYGGLNSLLYVSLLPLWEGFDEPFHYGYVQELSQHRRLPQYGTLVLSHEICSSLELAPQSHAVKQNLPWVSTFDEYFQLAPGERARRRAGLNTLPSGGSEGTCGSNYEAHQAPLAYGVLAPIDALLTRSSLLSRIWYLRMFCAVSSSVATAVALWLPTRRLRLEPLLGYSAIFVVFSSQMFYATVAHVANDWLAVPLMVFLFERLVMTWENPNATVTGSLGVTLGAALLTKSYFIAMVPLTVGLLTFIFFKRKMLLSSLVTFLAVVLILAAPWYCRNIFLYHNLSGMQETMGGLPLSALYAAATRLPWLRAGWILVLGGFWTGNNSFETFSRSTLLLLMAGYSLAGMSCAYRIVRRQLSKEQCLLLIGSITYGIALGYSAVVTYWSSGGKYFSPSPWYAEPIFPIVVVLLLSCLSNHRYYSIVAIWITTLSAYILIATYWVKLIPLYSGFSEGRMTIHKLIAWYANSDLLTDNLSSTAIKGAGSILLLGTIVVLWSSLLAFFLSRRWKRHSACRSFS